VPASVSQLPAAEKSKKTSSFSVWRQAAFGTGKLGGQSIGGFDSARPAFQATHAEVIRQAREKCQNPKLRHGVPSEGLIPTSNFPARISMDRLSQSGAKG